MNDYYFVNHIITRHQEKNQRNMKAFVAEI